MPKITKRAIDALKPDPEREIHLWDSELKGFGVRLQPTGTARYIVKYRTLDGRQRKMVIGSVGTLTPEQARQEARDKLAEAQRGADPAGQRQERRRAMTIAELCDEYLKAASKYVKPSTLAMDRSRIETHVKPLVGRLTVLSLTRDDVERMYADIAAGRTARDREGRGGAVTGGKGVASRTVGMLGTILEHAKNRRLVKENVARGIKKAPDTKRTRFLSSVEMMQLGEAMRQAEADGESTTGIAAIRFLLLTGCRRMEALSLPWAWLDIEGGCIRFGDTKSGAQIRPIGAAAFVTLEPLQRRNEWVFPASRGGGHFIGLPKVLSRLCERAKIERVSLHVLRHTFAATAAEMGYSELTIAGLLGHTVSGVTARYAHVPDRALLDAANAVSARIGAILDGTAESKVVALPRYR